MTFRACPGGSKKRRMLKNGVSIIDPSTLFASGEKGLWFDPSNFATMWQDSAGTTPVTAVGQPVGRIIDLSPNSVIATQATAASRPLLQVDGGGKFYLDFDGIDDFLVTGSIDFTTTDKMFVCSGLRKNSDAALSMAVELSVSYSANNGAWGMTAPISASASFGFSARGTATVNGGTPANYAAPFTGVVSGIADIAIPLLQSRVNSSTVVNLASSLGTGTFGNYPIYIGRRAGTSAPFTGRVYSIIVRGAAMSVSQINGTESYVNSKTGAF